MRWCVGLLSVALALTAAPTVETRASCFCTGKVGNVNGDSLDQVSLGDVAMLIDHLFVSGVDLPCPERANIDGDTAGAIDLADVSLLVEHLFISYEPLPDCPPPKDYAAYFWGGWGSGRIYRYRVVSHTLDTLETTYEPDYGMAVSADGSRLYLGCWNQTIVVDADSLQFIAALPYGNLNPPAVSPTGEYIALAGDDLSILRTADYSVLFQDTARLYEPTFSTHGLRFYGVGGWEPGGLTHVYSLDLADIALPVTRKAHLGASILEVEPSRDEAYWFVLLRVYDCLTAFAAYDVAADSVVYSRQLSAGFGDVRPLRSSREVLVTSPGEFICIVRDTFVTVYSTPDNDFTRRIYTPYHIGGDRTFVPCDLTTTPDGRWLIIQDAYPPARFYLYDLGLNRIADSVDVFHYRNITIQSGP